MVIAIDCGARTPPQGHHTLLAAKSFSFCIFTPTSRWPRLTPARDALLTLRPCVSVYASDDVVEDTPRRSDPFVRPLNGELTKRRSCLWLFVIVYGCLWLFIVACGCLWMFVAVYGCLWLFVFNFSYLGESFVVSIQDKIVADSLN